MMKKNKKTGPIRNFYVGGPVPIFLACWLVGCAGEGITYRPAPQILPSHIKRIAVRPFINKTQQFGLEEKLALRVVDEFLRDGRYAVVPESGADGVIVGTIQSYVLTPVQYDANLVPSVYKLQLFVDLKFLDRSRNVYLWEEPNMEGTHTYAASTLPGGLTEEEAREVIWDTLSRDIVKRTIEGFGSVTGSSEYKVPPPPDQKTAPKSNK